MFFNFIRPKIVVDAFTYVESIEKIAPISQASQYIPGWWKSLPKHYPTKGAVIEGITTPTMRSCPGVMELFPRGLILP